MHAQYGTLIQWKIKRKINAQELAFRLATKQWDSGYQDWHYECTITGRLQTTILALQDCSWYVLRIFPLTSSAFIQSMAEAEAPVLMSFALLNPGCPMKFKSLQLTTTKFFVWIEIAMVGVLSCTFILGCNVKVRFPECPLFGGKK